MLGNCNFVVCFFELESSLCHTIYPFILVVEKTEGGDEIEDGISSILGQGRGLQGGPRDTVGLGWSQEWLEGKRLAAPHSLGSSIHALQQKTKDHPNGDPL